MATAIRTSSVPNMQREKACLWLGGSNMNGEADLYLHSVGWGFEFGRSMAVGDFNADGYDDVAIAEYSLSDDIFPAECTYLPAMRS